MGGIQDSACATICAAYGLEKLSDLDVARLQALMPGVDLAEGENTLKFKTPAGHAVTTPFSKDIVEYQAKRVGGKEPYHAALARRLQDEALGVDRDVERERDAEANRTRLGKTLSYALLGGTAGSLLGSLAKQQSHGALIGGAVGALGGGLLGHSRPLERKSGPTSKHLDEISELYKEPENVKRLKQKLEELHNQVGDLKSDNDYYFGRSRRYDPLYRPGYYPYYGY